MSPSLRALAVTRRATFANHAGNVLGDTNPDLDQPHLKRWIQYQIVVDNQQVDVRTHPAITMASMPSSSSAFICLPV